MKKRIEMVELMDLADIAKDEYGRMPARIKLAGAGRYMKDPERVALSYYLAAVSILNRKGAIRKEWVDDPAPWVDLRQEDSFCIDNEEGGGIMLPTKDPKP